METLFLACCFFCQEDAVSLVGCLGSNNYRVRQTAHAKLALQMDTQLYFALRANPVKGCEAKSRLNSLLSRHESLLFAYYRAKMENTGYPAYPWIDRLPVGYEWEGFTGWQIQKEYFSPSFQADCSPNWTNYRNATEVWMNCRLSYCLGQSLAGSKNREEFIFNMDCAMKLIHRDLAAMIEGEDAWWGGKEKNPLRNKNK
ncbi:MAG TPA: hypothetical protein VI937_03325 [Negativicutes bacterium]|nr:hypothetical protein [Negativicutes bacterium]